MKNLNDNNIIAIYNYGSYVYGTNTEQSDKDIIVILEDLEKSQDIIQELKKEYDVNIYSKNDFETMIKEHEISALECLFLKDNFILKYHQWDFNLELPKLRNSISQKSSNSWVKAKKKFIVEKDYAPYIGQKSAWHSIRMLDFGIQIATYKNIIDYSSKNNLLKEILKCKTWEEIDKNFRKEYNETASRFREVAPKEINLKNKM
jgi:predicted nucleotidyltransferase